MKIHDLKCEKRFLCDVADGRKTFEVRKNDRDFFVGDLIVLRDPEPSTKSLRFEPNQYVGLIEYVLYGSQFPDGLQDGYCVIGFCGVPSVIAKMALCAVNGDLEVTKSKSEVPQDEHQ